MADNLGLVRLEHVELRVEVRLEEHAHLLCPRNVPVFQDAVVSSGSEDEVAVHAGHGRLVGAADGRAHRTQPGWPVKVDADAADVVHAPDDVVDALVGEEGGEARRVEGRDGVALDADEEGELGVCGALGCGFDQEGGVRLLEVEGGEVGLVSA